MHLKMPSAGNSMLANMDDWMYQTFGLGNVIIICCKANTELNPNSYLYTSIGGMIESGVYVIYIFATKTWAISESAYCHPAVAIVNSCLTLAVALSVCA